MPEAGERGRLAFLPSTKPGFGYVYCLDCFFQGYRVGCRVYGRSILRKVPRQARNAGRQGGGDARERRAGAPRDDRDLFGLRHQDVQDPREEDRDEKGGLDRRRRAAGIAPF